MPAPETVADFLPLVRESGLVEEQRLRAWLKRIEPATLPVEPAGLANLLVREGLLTHFQSEQLLQGKCRGFTLGKYTILERLGVGSMGTVFLCLQPADQQRVAVKVLPPTDAKDASSLKRFFREFRATLALDHPNIVRGQEIDQDKKTYFLVMDYVDGASLQQIVGKHGPLSIPRAAHYIHQAAAGLQYIHEQGLVHRDIKPGNLLVDCQGTVKILDLGLARFAQEPSEVLTLGVIGTPDYLAPEQGLDSHNVDIRADIYSLGGTFYYLLTGITPLPPGTIAKKLVWLQTLEPRPIREIRSEVPEGLVQIIGKMMAKDPAERYQGPAEIVQALRAWTRTPVPPPPEAEMPQLCPAARGSIETAVDLSITPTEPLASQVAPARPPARNAVRSGKAGPAAARAKARKHALEKSPASPPARSAPELSPLAPRKAWARWVMLAVFLLVAGATGFLLSWVLFRFGVF